jgi:hypothetical protein
MKRKRALLKPMDLKDLSLEGLRYLMEAVFCESVRGPVGELEKPIVEQLERPLKETLMIPWWYEENNG